MSKAIFLYSSMLPRWESPQPSNLDRGCNFRNKQSLVLRAEPTRSRALLKESMRLDTAEVQRSSAINIDRRSWRCIIKATEKGNSNANH